ncbi:sugar ABC transporter permease [Chloroflexota bacterium]|nr:sugar ABC transporter permease [Chloroflexota bacterium]
MKRRITPYMFMLPGLVAIGAVTLIPVLTSIYFAFTNYSTKHLFDYEFVWFNNFKRILFGIDQSNFLTVLSWTLVWTVITTLLDFVVGLVLAILLNNPTLKERNLYRTILIYPWALPATLTVMVWAGLLNSSFGPVNQLLAAFNISTIPWLTDPFWARLSCIIVNLWLAYPYQMSVCLGALQSIDPTLNEAAAIDGATKWQIFHRITMPLLRSATLPLLVISFAANFSGFGVIYLLTGGGPITSIDPRAPGATDLLSTWMYKLVMGDVSKLYGVASAIGIIIFIFVGGLTLINSFMTGAFRQVKE